jgi:predicted lipoprotein with Yx(FWY)xxD motif
MRTASIAAVVPIVAALLAGCGSSSKGTTSAPSAPPTGTSASAASSSTPTATTGVLFTTKAGPLGRVLAVGPKKLTVYQFEADTSSKSTCTGACASVWPPVTTTGQPRTDAHAAARASDLGTSTRSDGTIQVTFQGHPLYFYAKDQNAGDAHGQGIKSFGAAWRVIAAPEGVVCIHGRCH